MLGIGLGRLGVAALSRTGGGAPPFTGALDLISATSAAAYSLRKLRTAYTGPALRVRRSFDSAEADIGFTAAGDLDTAALLAHVEHGGPGPGNQNGFVTTWYDQSGNGRNVTQVTAVNQPRIVNAGVVYTQNARPSIFFDGSSRLSSNAPLAVAQAFSVMAIAGLPSTATEYTTGGASGLIALRLVNTQNRRVGISGAPNDFADPVDAGVLRQYTDTGNPNSMRRNGVGVVAGLLSNSSAGTNLTIGARDTLLGLLGHESELVFFGSTLSTQDRQTLERNQGAHFGVTVA
jgi:hypothetical protein